MAPPLPHPSAAASPKLDARVAWTLSALLGTTSFLDGATTQLPAFILRAGVMGLAVWQWPQPGARLEAVAACALASLAAAYSWGLICSQQLGLGVQPWVTLMMAIMAFIVARAQPQARQRGLRDGLLTIAVIHSVWGLGQKLNWAQCPTARAIGGFFSPIDLAAFLAPMAIWGMHAACNARSRRARSTYAVLAALVTTGLLTTNSRGGILAFVLSLLVALVWGTGPARWRHALAHRRSAPLVAIGLAVAIGLVSVAAMALRYRFDTAYDPDAFSRIEIWRACLRLFAAHPQGLGTGGLENAMRLEGVPTRSAVRYLHVANNAHNTFLQTALECGVLGVAAWILCLSAAAYALWHKRDAQHRWLAAMATALFLPALTATTWQLTVMVCVIALWAAETWPYAHSADAGPEVQRVSVGTRSMWAAIAISATCMLAPAALSHLCLIQARRLADGGQRASAVREWTERATLLAPWSVNTALLAEHLRALPPHAPSPLAQVEALVALADTYAHSPEPLRQAAILLESAAQTPDQHTQAATLWQMTAARDPHNALYWMYAARQAAAGHVPTDAPALFKQALAQEPHCAGAWLGLADEAHSQGDFKGVEHALGQVIASIQLASTQPGFARSVLTLDAGAQIRFNQLMHTLKEPS